MKSNKLPACFLEEITKSQQDSMMGRQQSAQNPTRNIVSLGKPPSFPVKYSSNNCSRNEVKSIMNTENTTINNDNSYCI
jgi:hypothetical protein